MSNRAIFLTLLLGVSLVICEMAFGLHLLIQHDLKQRYVVIINDTLFTGHKLPEIPGGIPEVDVISNDTVYIAYYFKH